MSLAEKKFSSGTTNSQPNRNDFGIVDDGVHTGGRTHGDIKLGAGRIRSGTKTSKEIEEEARPPYLHVRRIDSLSKVGELILTVHDCWRVGRNYRGSLDALIRYGQDATAR
jgi:hypothetical protein